MKERRRGRGRRITDLESHPEAYVTVQALAAHLTVHERTVRKWIESDVLPAYRFPPMVGEWRIATADAVAFVENARFKV